MDETTAPQVNKNRFRLSLILLGCAAVLLGAALLVGINDNLPGILLLLLSAMVAVLAFVGPLGTKRHYELLLLWSLVSLVAAAILHNVFDAAGSVVGPAWLKAVFEAIGVAFFFIAIIIGPAGALVGGIGIVVKLIHPPARPTS
jgi:hypothetical protein